MSLEDLIGSLGMNLTQTLIMCAIVFVPIIIALMIARSNNFLYGFVWYLLLISLFVWIVGDVLEIKNPKVGFSAGTLIISSQLSPLEYLKVALKLNDDIYSKVWFNSAFFGILMVILSFPTALINGARKRRRNG